MNAKQLSSYGGSLETAVGELEHYRESGSAVLLLCGERDQAGFTRRYNRNWEKRTGIPVLWVPGAGHNSNTDAPEFVNDAIKHFIKERVTV